MTQLEHKKPILKRVRRVVVKIGSQILSSHDGIEEARLQRLEKWMEASRWMPILPPCTQK